MGIKDRLWSFAQSNGVPVLQQVAQNASSNEDSTDIVDLGAGVDWYGNSVDPDYAERGKLWLFVQLVATGAGTSSAVLTITLITDTVNGFSTPTTLATQAIAFGAAQTAGTEFWRTPLPQGVQRYLKLNYATTGANITDAQVDAWVGWPSQLVK